MKKISTFAIVCMLIVTTHTSAQHSETYLRDKTNGKLIEKSWVDSMQEITLNYATEVPPFSLSQKEILIQKGELILQKENLPGEYTNFFLYSPLELQQKAVVLKNENNVLVELKKDYNVVVVSESKKQNERIAWWLVFPLIGILSMLIEYFFGKYGSIVAIIALTFTFITSIFIVVNLIATIVGTLISGYVLYNSCYTISLKVKKPTKVTFTYCFLMIAYMMLKYYST